MLTRTGTALVLLRPLVGKMARHGRPMAWLGLAVAAALLWAGPMVRDAAAADARGRAGKKAAGPKWESLFDGKTLKGWKAPDFGGQGKVVVKDGAIIMERGDTMTGVTYTGKAPTVDYELTLEGKRIDGYDFFATTTFPVGKSHCSLVVGGWGGSVVGLSSIDYADASENETTRSVSFKPNQWYRFRIRVTKEKIECWIDKEKMVDLVYHDPDDDSKNHKISIRMECDLCRPLGISTWCTTGAVRNIRIRRLSDLPAKQPDAEKPATEKK